MQKLTIILFSILITTASVSFSVTLSSLSKMQIKQAFINKTLTSIPTDNLNGKTVNNTNLVFLDNQGHIFGKLTQKPAQDPQTDKGVYAIDFDGTLHITWQHWDGGKKLCFHAFDTANAYINVGCDKVFHTAFMKVAIKPGNHLK